ERMANDKFLERHAVAKSQRPRTKPSNCASGYLDHPRAVFIRSKLCVDWPFGQSHRANRRGGRLDYLLLNFRAQPRRRHVNRFLEERTVERIRLVEDREHSKLAIGHQTFDGDFKARNKLFDQRLASE